MSVPHDFYSPWSDEPHLHNRHHSRPYVEPDWQAHAAGHQLPVLSTIGRGPRGYGMKVANYEADEKSFKFDIVCDDPNEEIQHIGPIPSGELILGQEAGAITLSSPYLKDDGTIGYKMLRAELPVAEPGSRIFAHLDSVPYAEDGFYELDAANLTYSNRRDAENLPEVRVWDSIIFKATDEDENDYLLVGDVLNADDQSELTVGVHLEYPIADLVGERGPQGVPGVKGDDGIAATVSIGTVSTVASNVPATVTNSGDNQNAVLNFSIPKGADGVNGTDGYSPTVAVLGTNTGHRVTITDAEGDHSFLVKDGEIPQNLLLIDHVTATIDTAYEDYPDQNRLVINDAMPIPTLAAVKYYVTVTNPDEIPLCTVQQMEINFTDGTSAAIDTYWNTTDDPSFKDFASIHYLVFSLDWRTSDIIVEDLAKYVKITNHVWETNPPNKHTTGIGVGTIMEFNDTAAGSIMEYYIDNDTIVHYPNSICAYSAISKYNFVIVANPVRGDSNLMLRMILQLSGGDPVHFSMKDNTFVVRDVQVISSRVWIYLEPLTWNALDEEDMTAQD